MSAPSDNETWIRRVIVSNVAHLLSPFMKTAIYMLIGILVCLQSCFAGPEGIWGGKWDDMWPVFLEIEKGADTNSYKVQYIWLENTSNSSFFKKERVAKQVGAHFEADFLVFKIDGDKGMLYGAFENPRMANLVKIDSKLPSVSECDAVLQKHQWKAEAIPASEALEKIKKQ